MKISAVNSANNIKRNYYACHFGNSASFSFPFDNVKPDNMDLYDFGDLYEKNFFDNLCEMKDEIYNHIDNAVFENGMSAKDILGSMFDMDTVKISSKKLLHKTCSSNCPDIIQNGFNPSKIVQTEYGPGFYFGTNEGELTIYSGETLLADYEGRTLRGVNLKDYNKLSSIIKNNLMYDYLGIKKDLSPFLGMRAYHSISKFVDQYARHLIADKLGIDGAYTVGSDSYFVVFNPKAIKKVDYYSNSPNCWQF